jgi:DNA excision repair protein ERCC-1
MAAAAGAVAAAGGVPSSQCILIHAEQRLNPALKAIRSVPVRVADIKPDFEFNAHTWGVFLSLRFHVLHPGYLAKKVFILRSAVKQLVVFVQVDVDDCSKPLMDVTTVTIDTACTLIVGSSPQEVGRYIESFKLFENKPVTSIQERPSEKHAPQV